MYSSYYDDYIDDYDLIELMDAGQDMLNHIQYDEFYRGFCFCTKFSCTNIHELINIPWMKVVKIKNTKNSFKMYLNDDFGDICNYWCVIRTSSYRSNSSLKEQKKILKKLEYCFINNLPKEFCKILMGQRVLGSIDIPFIGNIRGFDKPHKFYLPYIVKGFEDNNLIMEYKNIIEYPFIDVYFKDDNKNNIIPKQVKIPFSILEENSKWYRDYVCYDLTI